MRKERGAAPANHDSRAKQILILLRAHSKNATVSPAEVCGEAKVAVEIEACLSLPATVQRVARGCGTVAQNRGPTEDFHGGIFLGLREGGTRQTQDET
jgi:hypothetical protein